MQTKNCYGCPKHKLGCKSTCKHWKEHEKEKDEQYKADKILRDAGLKTRTVFYYNDYKVKNKTRASLI